MFKRVILATVTMFFQQWTGINAVLYYAPTIFKNLGLDSNAVSLLATGVVGIAMFLATIPAVMWIDKWGRKPTLVIGAIGMATCHIIIVRFLSHSFYNCLFTNLPRLSSPQRISMTGRRTRPPVGLLLSWFGFSLCISDTLGVLVLGLLLLRSGPCLTVRMESPLEHRPTG